ncbi:MAG: ATP-binding protein [Planctomycetes bacterium]|nr:ATP-binding protein [Planctomycetota bacterium]
MTGATASFLELRIGVDLGAVRVLNDLLEVAMRALGLPGELRHDLTLGVAELVANVCEHERGGRDGKVDVRLDVRDDEVRVTVLSSGEAFDLEGAIARAQARDPLDDEGDGGRGLLLLVGLFDEVRLDRDDGRNRITLRRRRSA